MHKTADGHKELELTTDGNGWELNRSKQRERRTESQMGIEQKGVERLGPSSFPLLASGQFSPAIPDRAGADFPLVKALRRGLNGEKPEHARPNLFV